MKIGYLGPEGSFTHIVTTKIFEKQDCQPLSSIPACIKAFEDGKVELAVVPIENSIEGTVNTTLDYLYLQSDSQVVAEFVLPIHQQLMVAESDQANWRQTIKKVLSHPQALAQCQGFLNEHFPEAEIEATSSTSYAAKFVSEHPGEGFVAIAPALSAETYGLKIVQPDIQDTDFNETRFWVLGKKTATVDFLPATCKKLSIGVAMPKDTPGALHKILSTFAWREINLSKIESRPLKTKLGEYFFLIDMLVEQPMQLEENALEEIKLLGGSLKVFGKYSVFKVSGI